MSLLWQLYVGDAAGGVSLLSAPLSEAKLVPLRLLSLVRLCKLVLKCAFVYALMRLRAEGRPSFFDIGRRAQPRCYALLSLVSAALLCSAAAMDTLKLVPSGMLTSQLELGDAFNATFATADESGISSSSAAASFSSSSSSSSLPASASASAAVMGSALSAVLSAGADVLRELAPADGAAVAATPVATLAAAATAIAFGRCVRRRRFSG
eukprot:6209233-Pleurochrysis_carterae.AAC.1